MNINNKDNLYADKNKINLIKYSNLGTIEKIKTFPTCETVVACVVNVYNKMPQPPPLQYLVDTISLLRKHIVNSISDKDLKTLYTPVGITFANANDDFNTTQKIDTSNSKDLDYIIKVTNPKGSFKSIFGDNIDAVMIENITEQYIPSVLNFFIHHLTLDNKEEKQHSMMKFLEARMLGLSYIGSIPTLPFHNNGKGKNIEVNYNFYTNQNQTTADKVYLDISNDSHLYKPPMKDTICYMITENPKQVKNKSY